MSATLRNGLIRVGTALLLLALTAVAASASGGGHADSGAVTKDFIWRCLNFAVMAGLLGYFLIKPFRNALSGRRDGIEKALADAQAAREEAEAKFAEYDSKLTRAAAEIEEMRASLRREGELERDRVLANAREMAEKIKAEAGKAAENEVARARTELRREASRLAIAMAEELLKKNVSAADQQRLVDEYMSKVGERN